MQFSKHYLQIHPSRRFKAQKVSIVFLVMKPELLIASKEVLKAGATTLGCASLCLLTLTVPSPSRQRDTQHEHYDLSTRSSQQDNDDHFTIVFDNFCGAWIQYKGENDGDFLYQLSTVLTCIKLRCFFS